MKKIKLNSKRLFVILLSGFIIVSSSGCVSSKKQIDNYNNSYTASNGEELSTSNPNEDKLLDKDVPTENQKEMSTDIPVKIPESENNQEKELTSEDKEVLRYFDEIKNNVKEVINSNKTEEVKDKLKGTFIGIIDFIFYDGEIGGIKFNDLTDGAKQNVLETATTIDNAIMTKFPNYKEDISVMVSGAYNKASELIKKGATNIKEFSQEKLGEENYNAIIEAKDELVNYTKEASSIVSDIASDIWDKGKTNVKNWYESFKNN